MINSLLSHKGVLAAMRECKDADDFNDVYRQVHAAHDFKNHDTTLRNGREDAEDLCRWAYLKVKEERK